MLCVGCVQKTIASLCVCVVYGVGNQCSVLPENVYIFVLFPCIVLSIDILPEVEFLLKRIVLLFYSIV